MDFLIYKRRLTDGSRSSGSELAESLKDRNKDACKVYSNGRGWWGITY